MPKQSSFFNPDISTIRANFVKPIVFNVWLSSVLESGTQGGHWPAANIEGGQTSKTPFFKEYDVAWVLGYIETIFISNFFYL